MKKKETAGSKIKNHIESNVDPYLVHINDITNEASKEYIANLLWCIDHAQKKIDCSDIEGHKESCSNRRPYDSNFYVVVLSKREKALQYTMRNYFLASLSCPTPSFDQSVYLYDKESGEVQYIWTVPDKETALMLLENKDKVDSSEYELMQFVKDFFDGKLHMIAKVLNKESDKSFKVN